MFFLLDDWLCHLNCTIHIYELIFNVYYQKSKYQSENKFLILTRIFYSNHTWIAASEKLFLSMQNHSHYENFQNDEFNHELSFLRPRSNLQREKLTTTHNFTHNTNNLTEIYQISLLMINVSKSKNSLTLPQAIY